MNYMHFADVKVCDFCHYILFTENSLINFLRFKLEFLCDFHVKLKLMFFPLKSIRGTIDSDLFKSRIEF